MAETGAPAADGPLRERAAAGLVALLAAVPYLPAAFRNGFVYDDYRFVVKNPHVTAPESWLRMLYDPVTVDPGSPTGIVRPLRTVAFALDHALFGASPAAFHLSSLCWHVLASVLCFFLLRRILASTGAALFGAALWAVHPLQTESVAWISSRGDVAMGACTLGSLLLALRSRGADRWLAASLGVGLAAMLFKESAIVLPLLVGVLRLTDGRHTVRSALLGAWPWLAVSLVYFTYRHSVMVGDYAHADRFVLGGSTAGTFATMFRGFGVYVSQSILPTRPAIDWYLPVSTSLTDPVALGWLVAHAAILATGVRSIHRAPAVAAGIGLFYAPLVPVANWPFNLGLPTAERFLYMPLVGLALLAAVAFRRARERAPATVWIAGVAILGLAVQSAVRSEDWRTRDTLWGAALATHETPRGSEHAAGRLIDDARDARAASRGASGPEERERFAQRNRDLLHEALGHTHDAIDLWHRIEGVTQSRSDVLIPPENEAAHCCFMLGEYGHALFHAETGLDISEASETAVPLRKTLYNHALALLFTDRGIAGLRALEAARASGMRLDAGEWGVLLLRAGELCRRDHAYEHALRAWRLGADWGGAATAARFGALAARHEARRTTLRAAYLADEQDAVREYARFLAGSGEPDRADAIAIELGGVLAVDIDWLKARYEARATADGWRAAIQLYRALAGRSARALFRIARCHDELGEREAAAKAYREAVDAALVAGEEEPWVASARLSLSRYDPGCPVRRDHGIR